MRVVLDTAVVVSALLFPAGSLTWLFERWTTSKLLPLVSRDTADELIRVLAYPNFRLERAEIDGVLAAYLPFTESVLERRPGGSSLPVCDDPADQKFLQLAFDGEAEALVTGDDHLLRLAADTPFEILRPGALRDRLR